MFGTSPAANGQGATVQVGGSSRGLPLASFGAVSQRETGEGPGFAGSAPPLTCGSVGSNVAASFEPGALQTVMSLSATLSC